MIRLNDNERILFQGDSITDGARGRNEDLNHIMGHGYQYIVASKLCGDNLDKNVSVINKGVSGNRISDLYGRWREDAVNLKPTLLSILIGVNDAGWAYVDKSGSSPERYEKIYRLMLDEILDDNKNLKLVIMEPFVTILPEDEKTAFMSEYTKELQVSAAKIAKEYDAAFVPLQNMFDEMKEKSKQLLIWDGIHPTFIGHELIARKWLNVVENKFYR